METEDSVNRDQMASTRPSTNTHGRLTAAHSSRAISRITPMGACRRASPFHGRPWRACLDPQAASDQTAGCKAQLEGTALAASCVSCPEWL